ncbi:MAG: hypothetical protein LRZ87_03905 [Methanocellales archaeon]|nr:hypothetical protein [Methanocellales archaeon]
MTLLLANVGHAHVDEPMGFTVPLAIGLLIGAICGLGGGVYYGKRK